MGIRKTYFNTPVMTAAEMVEFSDKDILKNSCGEVTKLETWEEDDDDNENDGEKQAQKQKGTVIDPEIFGELNQENVKKGMKMGHVSLPVPVLNINYLRGTKPVLPKMLKMDRKDVEMVAYYTAYLVTQSNDDKYPAGMVLGEKEQKEIISKSSVKTGMGAEAIEELMKNMGLSTDGIILHYIPVLPYPFRYAYRHDKIRGDIFRMRGTSFLLYRVMNRKRRLERLLDLGAPEVIMKNESRMMQEHVDAYINNGARGYAILNQWGAPCMSLQDFARMIRGINEKEWDYSIFDNVDVDRIMSAAKEDGKLYEELGPEDSEWGLDEDGQMKEDEILQQMQEDMRPFLMEIAKMRFPSHEDFHQVIVDEGLRSLKKGVEDYAFRVYVKGDDSHEDDREALCDDFLAGVIPAMDLRARNLAFA